MADKSYPSPPNLQAWVRNYGGYDAIPWDLWNKAMAEWHVARRRYTAGNVIKGSSPRASKHQAENP